MAITTKTTINYFCQYAPRSNNGILDDRALAIARVKTMPPGSFVLERTTVTEHDSEDELHAWFNFTVTDKIIYCKEG